ncbi:hypothetical protein [Streptomyces sp. NBC_00582]|uniref:hypothetical protein n=1 Tax=Streptomyces sp. NBC_00582 TaxID=2975783 RepID=UPI002E816FD3|nr:hypothetical protein [Streptomyces sp. NBC_00582]WUB63427.1 hypothetical protein OG852_25010 [Streptomyces sp. NBC_00582]
MSTAARLPRSRAWLRVLVLVLALLLPGAPAEVSAAPVVVGEIIEYDADATAFRPAPCAPRPAAPPLPAPRPAPAPGEPAARPLPAPPGTPYAPHILLTVVLRC